MENLIAEADSIKNSKQLNRARQLATVNDYGPPSLFALAALFTNTGKTNIYSDCWKRSLTAGEVAMIFADHTERVPYATLTGMQNCTLTFS
ncbi:hypothetical protein [Niabella aurantiaca]|uniref:hypothetical protein n=1 Tax=Niabella aurantiaca TaxID=379900 RepID=UPI000381F360|nr:hypothetical protein [Niabella aurantiaca]